MDNTITIKAGGYEKSGWTDVDISRGIESVPSFMQLSVTEEFPNNTAVLPLAPGQPCVVTIGKDTILTGYIDRYSASYSDAEHTVSIAVRSKMEDSVDASAEFSQNGGQVNGMNLAQIANQLTEPYGIKVVDKAQADDVIPSFIINLGETSFDIITRVAHTMATLVYDDSNGNLVLAKVGQEGSHSSGFVEGEGLYSCAVNFSMDQRFSQYITIFQGVNLNENLGFNLIEGKASDTDVPRNRKKFIISPVPANNGMSAETWGNNVAQWAKNRAWGRGQAVELVCDTWRDTDGRLWCPNAYAVVHSPTVHIIKQKWIIGQVKYSLHGDSGTTCSLLLMPPEAFSIQPSTLFRLPPNLTPAASGSASTATSSGVTET